MLLLNLLHHVLLSLWHRGMLSLNLHIMNPFYLHQWTYFATLLSFYSRLEQVISCQRLCLLEWVSAILLHHLSMLHLIIFSAINCLLISLDHVLMHSKNCHTHYLKYHFDCWNLEIPHLLILLLVASYLNLIKFICINHF